MLIFIEIYKKLLKSLKFLKGKIMREIKEIEEQAYQNVEGFDHAELCYKTVFNILNDNDVFVKVFRELTTYNIEDKSQIKLDTFKYDFVKEKDEKVYPIVDLVLWLKNLDSDFGSYFCLTLTPFNAGMNNLTKDAGVYGSCDEDLTKIWRVMMKGFFKDKYVKAFKKYCEDVKCLKESKIATQAEIEYRRIEKRYEDEINSI